MGKRRIRPVPGDRKFHAPKAKRALQETPGAVSMAVPLQSSDPDGNPDGMDTLESGGEAETKGIAVEQRGAGSPQEGRDKEIRSDRALESPKQGISDEMEQNHLELGILEVDGTGGDKLESPKMGILDGAGENCPESPKTAILDVDGTAEDKLESPKIGFLDGAGENCPELPQVGILEGDETGEDKLESPKTGILDGAGENCPESPKPAILEVDEAGEEPPESMKHLILDGMGQNHLESSQLGILEGNGAAEEQPESPQLRIPEADGAGEEQVESLRLGILDGTGEDQLESPKPGISEVDGAAEEQLESPKMGILDGTGEEHPERVKTGIPEEGEAREEQPEPLKTGISEENEAREEQPEPLEQGIWDEAGENQPESPKEGNCGAQGSSPEDTVMDTESLEVPDAAAEEEKGALEEGSDTGTVLRMDTESPDCPSDAQGRAEGRNPQDRNSQDRNPQGWNPQGRNPQDRSSQGRNSSMAIPGTAATSTEPHEQQEGTSPELPTEKTFPDPRDTTGQIHTGPTGNSPRESAGAAEPADASDVVRGLIRELSDLNRLAMGARRGLELLRRPKPRRGRRAVTTGSRWKEG